ncbi:unnamed protein product [Lactuca saligna]|uniref:Uncharacterized protein n=1 Tax=Lactuca saligna TaxID=75948 RepID=A0AA35YNY3_LACSI|nr:unnamed protein product [Lactuca saligna]
MRKRHVAFSFSSPNEIRSSHASLLIFQLLSLRQLHTIWVYFRIRLCFFFIRFQLLGVYPSALSSAFRPSARTAEGDTGTPLANVTFWSELLTDTIKVISDLLDPARKNLHEKIDRL